MNIKKLTALILLPVLLMGLFACKKQPDNEGTTKAPPDVTNSFNEITTLAPSQEETTLSTLEFNEEAAQLLGEFNTEIYGILSVYFQEDRLFLLDSYSAKRFELYAFSYLPNYEDSPIELIGDDVNFDGYTDFYLLYSKGNLNTYYCFWIWDMTERTFKYYLPLSSVASPTIDAAAKRIISLDKISNNTAIETEYSWNNGEIVPVSTSEKKLEIEDATEIADEPDPSVAVMDGIVLSTVTMRENPAGNYKWVCSVEDERIVKLSANTLDRLTGARTFLFRGIRPGTTTVVLRYTENNNDAYILQRILNITVSDNYVIEIKVVE